MRPGRGRRGRTGRPGVADAGRRRSAAQGYDVVVNKVGSAPLDACTVRAIRPGQRFARTDSGVPGAMGDLHTTVTPKTVYVDVTC
ncbi:hypothetical protein ACWDTP_21030 [Mycobacterium sp. NPDC003449]